ncbi:MAG: DUF3313 domain-containing protein [Planctomycetota bacterium]|jgi:hypothetical protein
MKTKTIILMTVCVLAVVLSGCGSKELVETGFLSDYSKLKVESKTAMVYVNEEALSKYHKFMIEPIQTRLYADTDITEDELAELRQYMYKEVYNAIEAKDKVVHEPGSDVMRLRLALTNLKKSNVALNVLPQTKLTGMGLGAASLEAEGVDSITGEQVMAVVKSQSGNQFSLDGYSKWSDVESIIRKWADHLQERLAEADEQ